MTEEYHRLGSCSGAFALSEQALRAGPALVGKTLFGDRDGAHAAAALVFEVSLVLQRTICSRRVFAAAGRNG
jgi:hypothetical protein